MEKMLGSSQPPTRSNKTLFTSSTGIFLTITMIWWESLQKEAGNVVI
jgi:hypothetical protein